MSFKRKPPQGNVRRVAARETNSRGVVVNRAGSSVQFETWPQRVFLLVLDRDPTVKDYGSQPVEFDYRDQNGRERRHVPAFIVWRYDGSVEIHDILKSSQLVQAQFLHRQKQLASLCEERGWVYVVHDEVTLPTDTEVANLLLLSHYRPTAYADDEAVQLALSMLEGRAPIPIARLATGIAQHLHSPENAVVPAILHLVWHGVLATDLSKLLFPGGHLSSAATVWVGPGSRGSK